MLTITYANGSMMFLNIASPHTIYTRTIDQKRPPPMSSPINGISSIVKSMINGSSSSTDGMDTPSNGESTLAQLFAQANGQIVELCNERVAIKSVWEYFLEKNSQT